MDIIQENLHTCSLCREGLFIKFNKPEFIDGARDVSFNGRMLHQIKTWTEAKKSVKLMWVATYELYERSQTIYDSDIEEQVNPALARTAENDNHTQGLYIFSDHWNTIRLQARDMVRAYFKNRGYLPLSNMECRGYLQFGGGDRLVASRR
jgi:hypothetical protein